MHRTGRLIAAPPHGSGAHAWVDARAERRRRRPRADPDGARGTTSSSPRGRAAIDSWSGGRLGGERVDTLDGPRPVAVQQIVADAETERRVPSVVASPFDSR
jgi:hypothetical protein